MIWKRKRKTRIISDEEYNIYKFRKTMNWNRISDPGSLDYKKDWFENKLGFSRRFNYRHPFSNIVDKGGKIYDCLMRSFVPVKTPLSFKKHLEVECHVVSIILVNEADECIRKNKMRPWSTSYWDNYDDPGYQYRVAELVSFLINNITEHWTIFSGDVAAKTTFGFSSYDDALIFKLSFSDNENN